MEKPMSDLTPEDKALLDLAREGHEPTARDRSRVRAALIAQLGVSTGLTAAAAASSSSAAAGIAGVTGAAGAASAGVAGVGTVASGGGAVVGVASATFVLAAKVLTAVGIAGAVVGGGVAAHRALRAPQASVSVSAQIPTVRSPPVNRGPQLGAPEQVAPPSPNKAMETQVVTAPSDPARPKSAIALLSRTAWPIGSQAPTALAAPSPTAPAAPSPTAPAAPSPTAPAAPAGEVAAAPVISESELAVRSPALSPTTLEAETRLVRAGVAALHEHDPVRALALFDEHARSYPLGTLAEERAAARVNALCDLGQVDNAQAAAAAFLRDRPASPLAARVRTACLIPHGGRTNP
jgi:hypothetical protein